MKITIIIIFVICSCLNIFGQDRKKIDSLWNAFSKAKHDTTRINIYLNIGDVYKYEKTDTALLYYDKALNLTNRNIGYQEKKVNNETTTGLANIFALLKANSLLSIGTIHLNMSSYDIAFEYYLKSLKIYEESANKRGISDCYTNIGMIRSFQGAYNDAIIYHLKSFKINEELGNKKGMATSHAYIGNVHIYQGNYDKAIEFYFKSLKIREELADKKGISDCYSGIGIVHDYQGNYDKAIEYYLKSLKISEELKDKRGMSNRYSNIGIVYYYKNNNDKALEYYLKSLKIDDELGDKRGMSDCYNNIGIIYNSNGTLEQRNGKVDQAIQDYSSAIEYYSKSLKIKEELGDFKGIATVYGNISRLHINLAESSKLNGKGRLAIHLKAAIEFGNKAYEIAKEINSIAAINKATENLFLAYKAAGNYKKSLEFAEIFIATKDSMFSEEKTKTLAEMGTKYESEKKQLEIEKMQKQKELDTETIARKNAESKKQRILIFSFLAGFLIILVFSVFLYRLFIQKKKANVILAKQKEEISAQRDEIETQRDLVTEQKVHIEEMHKEVTDSINYAKRIQEAVLPVSVAARSIMGEHFVLFKPKDIVSGDFYWTTKINNWLIVAVADCTGHGVPGAFMSMLGISFLNEIVNKNEITKANQVLTQLRIEIINALQQKGEQGEQKDGMDISLCVINTITNECQWSGANNSLFLISSTVKELKEIKPDKQPIAIHPEMKAFTNHEIKLQKGDILYLLSDGYEDQFGGPKYKKFMVKQLKELFVNISDKSMNDQKEILDNTFESWKGIHEQIDDVTILGLRI